MGANDRISERASGALAESLQLTAESATSQRSRHAGYAQLQLVFGDANTERQESSLAMGTRMPRNAPWIRAFTLEKKEAKYTPMIGKPRLSAPALAWRN
jgi:hypothetical protein